VLAAGGTAAAATQASMLVLAAATAISGALLYALGLARWGRMLRFVPHFVVAGFLAATGWLLIAGGVIMSTGRSPAALWASIGAAEAMRLACAVAVFVLLFVLRRTVRSALALPLTLLAMIVLGSLLLHALGLDGRDQGWYLASPGAITAWLPWQAWRDSNWSGADLLRMLPELLAASVVAVVSLVSKVSALEVARERPADLDQELRAHGLGTLAVVPLGGVAAMLQLSTSRLLEAAGGATRFSGAACALWLLVIALTGFDLLAVVPLPVAAGLVFFLGWGFLVDALGKPLVQRDGLNLALAVAIGAACVVFGFLVGVLGGIVAACLLFALSYARLGAVRQQLSRAQYAGHVSRPAEAARHLLENGEQIQVHWLAGYLFFGSSEGVFERVRRDLEARPGLAVRHVILDFERVTGADASATVSLVKLRHLCRQHGVVLVFSSVAEDITAALRRDGLFRQTADGQQQPLPFADVNEALAWCEDRLLTAAGLMPADGDDAGFAEWLQRELGEGVPVGDFLRRLDRRQFDAATVLYRQGEPADEIDLVAAGRLAVDVVGADGRARRVRTLTTRTVVGEMGFISRAPRSATVVSDGPATVYTLSRDSFERLRRERPEVAAAFDDFLLRTLAARLGMTERMMSALSG
jgi:SulP family sulfate permease